MSNYIMITGPAAVGKSTLCTQLSNELPAFFYKPAMAYFDLSKLNNIPQEKMFSLIDSKVAIEYFCEICKKYDTIVGDQHLAIQPKKDSALAAGKSIESFLHEPFVSAIDYNIFNKMYESSILPIMIYLKANPEILFERAYRRNVETGFPIRNKTLNDVIEEVMAEEYYYDELIKATNIDSVIFDTSKISTDTICGEVKNLVKKRR